MPVVAILFILYAMLGPHLPPPWTHRGYDFPRLVGHLFITLEGIFGVAVDVSATLIILFTIYGAFLDAIRRRQVLHRLLARAHGRQAQQRRPGGRAVVVPPRRTVGIGRRDDGDDRHRRLRRCWRRPASRRNAAGGLLAAGGLGAILSPPVLGAAAFLIAEFLKISYLDVIWMATDPDLPLLLRRS